jgi:hypothetical protein
MDSKAQAKLPLSNLMRTIIDRYPGQMITICFIIGVGSVVWAPLVFYCFKLGRFESYALGVIGGMFLMMGLIIAITSDFKDMWRKRDNAELQNAS